ncbi:phage terminase small subunit P27 family [Paenibacillus sp. NRS-1760]|uniref:phage terminase small subunit P27 family n=1 Tax=Paenibacillus sp. NRS-1760 TaxID=3233902 RepID=UPI003D2DE3D6
MSRPVKPTSLKVINGTNRKDRALNEPQPTKPSSMPEPPVYFDEVAKEEWNRLGPELLNLGLFTVADQSAFTAYCLTYSRLINATVSLNEAGELFHEHTNKVGATNYVSRPELAVIQRESLILKAYCTEFGLTPSARGRMEIPKVDSD